MINQLKRLFGIKPTESKVEVAPVQEVIAVPTPEVVPEPAVVVVEVVPEPIVVVVEVVPATPEVVLDPVPEPELVVEATAVEVKNTPRKTRTKKTKK